jgi:hypothetical protein
MLVLSRVHQELLLMGFTREHIEEEPMHLSITYNLSLFPLLLLMKLPLLLCTWLAGLLPLSSSCCCAYCCIVAGIFRV